ncbi:hypothetical protein F4803DRAFT_50887 [Xylaria telfairii]|nr:hypothetical protein F4803DRAFT_50887 [Xylaria telfairii]
MAPPQFVKSNEKRRDGRELLRAVSVPRAESLPGETKMLGMSCQNSWSTEPNRHVPRSRASSLESIPDMYSAILSKSISLPWKPSIQPLLYCSLESMRTNNEGHNTVEFLLYSHSRFVFVRKTGQGLFIVPWVPTVLYVRSATPVVPVGLAPHYSRAALQINCLPISPTSHQADGGRQAQREGAVSHNNTRSLVINHFPVSSPPINKCGRRHRAGACVRECE